LEVLDRICGFSGQDNGGGVYRVLDGNQTEVAFRFHESLPGAGDQPIIVGTLAPVVTSKTPSRTGLVGPGGEAS
jgi:hypothetical protein